MNEKIDQALDKYNASQKTVLDYALMVQEIESIKQEAQSAKQ
jgi:hypothetical protein